MTAITQTKTINFNGTWKGAELDESFSLTHNEGDRYWITYQKGTKKEISTEVDIFKSSPGTNHALFTGSSEVLELRRSNILITDQNTIDIWGKRFKRVL